MRIVFRCDPALYDRLPRPVAARGALPDWLRSMPASAFSELHDQQIRTVKQCPPFVDAMAYGFVMPLPCDVTVRDGKFSWSWELPPLSVEAHPRSPLSFHVPAQVSGTPFHDARPRRNQIQQLLDDRARTGLLAVRNAPGKQGGPAVPPAHRPGRCRSLQRCRNSVSGSLGRSELQRRLAGRNACGTMLSGHPRRCRAGRRAALARSATALRRDRRGAACRTPAFIGGATAPGVDDQSASEWRNAARSSHTSPIGATARACAMRPNVSGRSLNASR